MQWHRQRDHRRVIVTLAVVLILGRCRSRYPARDGRRLTEARRAAQSQINRPALPLRPWLDPPAPRITGHAWDAATIEWVENSFRFANHGSGSSGSYLYTPHQIQKAFRHHSVLLQGDSTVRRLYGSLHGILSSDVWTGSTSGGFPQGFPSQVPSPPFGVPSTYFVRRGLAAQAAGFAPATLLSLHMHSPSPIDPRLLEHRTVVDVNKDFYAEPCRRALPPSYVTHTPSSPPDKGDTNTATTFTSSQIEYKICRLHPTGGWLPPAPRQTRTPNAQLRLAAPRVPLFYDYINTNCLGHIHDFVSHELSHHRAITRQYSLYIVGPGAWETVKQAACRHPFLDAVPSATGHDGKLQWPDTLYQLLQETLEKVALLAQRSPELLIVWRTGGYNDGDAQRQVAQELTRRAVAFVREWNDKQSPHGRKGRSNLLCLDLGAAVARRSHGRRRLRGDTPAHYALEVRVLQVQMLANLLYEHGYAS